MEVMLVGFELGLGNSSEGPKSHPLSKSNHLEKFISKSPWPKLKSSQTQIISLSLSLSLSLQLSWPRRKSSLSPSLSKSMPKGILVACGRKISDVDFKGNELFGSDLRWVRWVLSLGGAWNFGWYWGMCGGCESHLWFWVVFELKLQQEFVVLAMSLATFSATFRCGGY